MGYYIFIKKPDPEVAAAITARNSAFETLTRESSAEEPNVASLLALAPDAPERRVPSVESIPVQGQLRPVGTNRDEMQEAVVMTPDTTTERRCLAIFQPQQWIYDYAVDSDPSYDFDITDQVDAMGRLAALAIKDSSCESDDLWETWIAAHPEQGVHRGPFWVRCEDAIAGHFSGVPDDDDYRTTRA